MPSWTSHDLAAHMCKINQPKCKSETPNTGQLEVGRGGIQDQVEEEFRRQGIHCAVVRSRTDKPTTLPVGTPDFIGCMNGKAFAVECKRPGQKPTQQQVAQLYMWQAAGAKTAVIHSAEEAREFIKTLQ